VSAVQTVAPYFQDFDFNIEGENILLRWQHVNDLSNLGFSAQTLSDGTARFICMASWSQNCLKIYSFLCLEMI
jgi:predicted ATPase